MIVAAKWLVVGFGMFLIAVGLLMGFAPERARSILRKAGSTNLINYTEITLRMIPAAGLILAAELSKLPLVFKALGWFMLVTSLVLYLVPRKTHHGFSLQAAEILKPNYFRLISPFAVLFGGGLIYLLI